MDLLSEDTLQWSPIVANSSMNRERNASGINSYEKEFKFKPQDFLEQKLKEFGSASWLDLCCGKGNALIQTAEYLSQKGLLENVKLKGIDLLDFFAPKHSHINNIEFSIGSIIDWKPDSTYDLITCSHGLHYIGDKLHVVESAVGALNPHGLFIANMDLSNIYITGQNSELYIKKLLKLNKLDYNNRTKILKKTGGETIQFNLVYKGADDKTGPNYTGQDAVTSYYSIK